MISSAGSPKKTGGALVFQHQQLALDDTDGRSRDIAVARRQGRRVFGQMLQQGAQILEIEQQKALLVGQFERDIEHAFLDVVQFEQAREEQRSHIRNGGADRMALFAEQVPERDREIVGHVSRADVLRALQESRLRIARHGDA